MDNFRRYGPRCPQLQLSREKFGRIEQIDSCKDKRRASSYRISDVANIPTRSRRITFEDEPVDVSTPRAPSKVKPIEDLKRDAKLMATKQRLAKIKILTDLGKNEMDSDTYAQMVKREPLSYRSANLLSKPKGPRRSPLNDVSTDFLPSRGVNIQLMAEVGNRGNLLTRWPRNRLNLDKYAQMVVNNDKQCPNRIKKLARPKRYFEIEDPWSPI